MPLDHRGALTLITGASSGIGQGVVGQGQSFVEDGGQDLVGKWQAWWPARARCVRA